MTLRISSLHAARDCESPVDVRSHAPTAGVHGARAHRRFVPRVPEVCARAVVKEELDTARESRPRSRVERRVLQVYFLRGFLECEHVVLLQSESTLSKERVLGGSHVEGSHIELVIYRQPALDQSPRAVQVARSKKGLP